jgi:glutathione synthase/RimK-type ligase-like ATP-grasp enzyme
MKIGIHHTPGSFSERWIEYCDSNAIPWKPVNCYENNILEQLADCDALMWHFHHNDIRAALCTRQLIYSLATSGKKVFPDFNTAWHFDDKIGQKYLLDAINAPFVKTWIFYDKKEALKWAKTSIYPLVFKLRSGAGSRNVKLVKSTHDAIRLINRSFGRGYSRYDRIGSLQDRLRQHRAGKTDYKNVIKGIIRLFFPPEFSRKASNESGYVYFQEFIPENDSDIRVIVIDNKAFAIKRMVRTDDFRASGSGYILYEKELFDERTIKLSIELAKEMKSQCIAFDFVYKNSSPLITEISYGFSPEGYDKCPGFWDEEIKWHESSFNPYGWMVEAIILEINEQKGQNLSESHN